MKVKKRTRGKQYTVLVISFENLVILGRQPIDAIKSGTDGEILWGLLRVLGFLGLAIVVILMFSRRKSQEMM